MLDCSGLPSDLSLVTRPGDDVLFVCASDDPGAGWRRRAGQIYVVVHRSDGVWTHVYRVAPGARVAVFIEKVLPGDQSQAACCWARRRFAAY